MQLTLLKIINHIRAYHNWYIFGALAALTLLSIILRLVTPQPTAQITPSPPPISLQPTLNRYKNILPGDRVTLSDISKVGEVISSSVSANTTTYSLKSAFLSKPNKVVVNIEGEVLFIEENILTSQTKEYLRTYIVAFGQPDLTMFNEQLGDAVKSYIFLNQGVVVTAHELDGSIEQKWYFSPTTKVVFLQTIGKNLSASPDVGH